jgi:hypothetical protein
MNMTNCKSKYLILKVVQKIIKYDMLFQDETLYEYNKNSEQCKLLKSVRFYYFYGASNISYFEMKLYTLVEHNISYL